MDGLRKFFEFYGGLEEGEVTAVVLLARKKYAPEVGKSERIIDYILLRGPLEPEKMEKMTRAFIEKYTKGPVYTASGEEVPPKALSFNILTSPRPKERVVKKYVTKTVMNALDKNLDAVLNAKWQLLSALMATGGKRHILFDVDEPGERGIEIVMEILDNLPGPHLVMRTHGGYHVLMKRGEWLKNLAKYRPPEHVEWKNIVMTALPGTPRGGRVVEIIDL